jgi:hypothetical protein
LAVATAVGLEVCLKALIIIPIHPFMGYFLPFPCPCPSKKAIEKLLSECIIYAEHIRQGVESFGCPKESFFPNPNRQSTLGNGVFLSTFLKNGENNNKKKPYWEPLSMHFFIQYI